MRILVVEDEPKVARFLERGLRQQSYAVDVAPDGPEGLHLARENGYDLIVLDVMLPGIDGFSVLRELRRQQEQPRVLMLTARDGVHDRVRGLDLGADDYLVKPFDLDEFLARVRALLRRSGTDAPLLLTVADLELDPRTRSVRRAGQPVELTAKPFAILDLLMRRAGEVVTRAELAEHVWDRFFDPFSNVIDVTMHQLRDKVDRGFSPRLIHTVRGVGYVLRDAKGPPSR
ncbi:MAG: response regulator transcription factor [Verrucomicrobia bacterium]|nr:response regulator transcription factor [Verrucomicrobiota bacterium]